MCRGISKSSGMFARNWLARIAFSQNGFLLFAVLIVGMTIAPREPVSAFHYECFLLMFLRRRVRSCSRANANRLSASGD